MPLTWPSFGWSRAMISVALSRRSARGLRVTDSRPLLVVGLVPSAPMKEATPETSGSARMTATTCCWSSDIREKLTSGPASVMPVSSPVSCTGKKPLGMTSARTTVSRNVPMVMARVRGWWRSTQSTPRPYPAMTRSKLRSLQA